MLALSFMMLVTPAARAETRTLKLYFIHTGEKAEITFKRNGRYDQAGLKKVNKFLRDWRRNEPTKMDPRLLDLVWETYRSVGGRDYIHVVSAYRSPATNSMLRSRSKGVANKSQHMLGKAMDFYIPGVSLKKLRDTGLKMQNGGVGYYPRSGSPFVHLDVGNVRHWPRMSRKELVAVFPNGKTLHVPSDGKPLPGFETAVASYQARKKSGGTAVALASSGGSKSGGLFAALFGGGADEEEESGAVETVAAVKPKPAKPAVETRVAAVEPSVPAVETRVAKSSGKIQIVPPELANPAYVAEPAATESAREETPEAIIASLPARSIPLPAFAPRPQADVGPTDIPFGVAEAMPDTPFGVAEAISAETEDQRGEEIAASVPVPTWRPEYAPQSEDAGEDPVLLAMAAPVNPPRSVMIGVPLPEGRPDGEFSVAGLLESGEAITSPTEDIEAEVKSNNARLAMLTTASTPKDAVRARPKGSDPTLAIGSGVKTTRKTARARTQDTKPAPKPLVVAVQPDATRWALYSGDYVADASVAAPSVAHLIVRTAPSEVYAAGFQQGAEVADAGRFTGKAVSFMPVARFVTN